MRAIYVEGYGPKPRKPFDIAFADVKAKKSCI